jgi:hypothetical protein
MNNQIKYLDIENEKKLEKIFLKEFEHHQENRNLTKKTNPSSTSLKKSY